MKISIIGSGIVGSTFAYSSLIYELASEIVLIDQNRDKADGEVMDLNHSLPFVHQTNIYSGDFEDCKDSDIIVITAGAHRNPNETRLDLAKRNFDIFKKIIPEIVKYSDDSILVVVTNPVDVMTYVTLKYSKFPENRVIGTGTVLDTARFRSMLGEYFKVNPGNVHAYIIGEHGDSSIPILSSAIIGGTHIKDLDGYNEVAINSIVENVKQVASQVIAKKGATNYAISLGLVKIIKAILQDQKTVLPVSSYINDYCGINDVCLSVPTILDKSGIRERLTIRLDEKELEGFRNSANVIKSVIDSLGI